MSLGNEKAPVLANSQVGPNLYLMEVRAPHVAAEARPGQFVHVQVPGMEAHILRRPLGVYSCDAARGTFDMLYQVVGFGTERMTELAPGEELEVIGPICRGWQVPEGARRALVVGGGVGAAPLYMLVDGLVRSGVDATVVLGSQTSAMLVFNDRFEQALGRAPRCSTDDGSFGHAGFCTPLVEQALAEAAAEGRPFDYLAVCGPEPLMRAVAALAAEAGVPCEVSLEKRMACGVGACLSCVVDTVGGKRRACVDGPVFPAEEVVW